MLPLVLDVVHDRFDTFWVDAKRSVSVLPDDPSQGRPRFAKPSRCSTFDMLDQAFKRNLRVQLDQQVRMVVRATTLDQGTIKAADDSADIRNEKTFDFLGDPRGIPVGVKPDMDKHPYIARHQHDCNNLAFRLGLKSSQGS
ncbi:MAG TPA: hypothetical protein PK208_07310 [Fibrobacteria bacterium]|nr:hypothetical protein [Fibrobacteria bacterium]